MGGSTGCLRSRLPEDLSRKQLTDLADQTDLSVAEVNQWYSSFVHCYPHGYLSERKFISYYQQLIDEPSPIFKPLIKQLFPLFDTDEDQRIDFEEFLRLNVLISDGSVREKIDCLANFYTKKNDREFSRNQLREFLRDLFDLFDMSLSKSQVNQLVSRLFDATPSTSQETMRWTQVADRLRNSFSLVEQFLLYQSDDEPSESHLVLNISQRF